MIYQRGLGVLIDEETSIKKKRIFNKNSQHHQSLLGCIICPLYYLHGPIVQTWSKEPKTPRTWNVFKDWAQSHFTHFTMKSLFFFIQFLAILLICIHQWVSIGWNSTCIQKYYFWHKMNTFSMKSTHPKIVYWQIKLHIIWKMLITQNYFKLFQLWELKLIYAFLTTICWEPMN